MKKEAGNGALVRIVRKAPGGWGEPPWDAVLKPSGQPP